MSLPLQYTVVLVDVAHYSRRTNEGQLAAREWLFPTLDEVFSGGGGGHPGFSVSERGDGALVMVPASVSPVQVLRAVLVDLAAAVTETNAKREGADRLALRVSVHAGLAHTDPWGSVSSDVNLPARMDAASAPRRAMRRSGAELGVIVSEAVYDQAVRHGYDGIDPRAFQRIRERVKGSTLTAWLAVSGAIPPLPGLGFRRPRWLVVTAATVVVALAAALALVSPTGGPDTPAGPPFAAYADYMLDNAPAAVHPKPLGREDFPTTDRCRDVERWAVRNGGAYASRTPVRLTLIGQGQRTVVIQRVTAKVTERLPPMAGTELFCGSSGAFPVIPIGIDLDADEPQAQRLDEHGATIGPYFANSQVQVGPREGVVFDLVPTTKSCTCTWTIELSYIDSGVGAGAARTVTVAGIGGAPFRTAADGSVVHEYGELGGVWRGN
jgi:hypothetical protein